MQPAPTPPDKWLSFGLAFVGGYGDAAGFVLARTFTGHITGNMVLAAIAIASHDWPGILTHLSAILCFLVGILLSVLLARLAPAPTIWPHLPVALGVEMSLIAAAYLALASHAAVGIEMFVICLSLALGMQNGAFRRTGGISVHTNYLTGMITGMIATKAERYAFPAVPAVNASDSKVSLLCGIWVAFVLGATIGAAMVFHFKELGILGAALLLLVIVVHTFRRP